VTERIDTSVGPDEDGDGPDNFALWEAGERDLDEGEERSLRAAIAKALGKVAVEQKLAAHEHAGFDPLKHPRVPKGSGDESGEFVSAHSVARALAAASLLDPEPLSVAGPTGTDDAAYERDAARVRRRATHYANLGLDTETLYDRVDGSPNKYTADREAVHRRIIDHFVNAPGVKSERKLLILGGLPGAGKSSFLKSEEGRRQLGDLNLDDYVVVNSDEVKAYMAANGLIPDYRGLTKGEAVGLYHEEAALLSKAILEKAAAQGKNIVFDTTLKNAEQGEKATMVLDRNGDRYERTALFIDVPVDLAVQRAKYRYHSDTGPDGGRLVPVGNIAEQTDPTGTYHSKNRAAFEKFKQTMDRWFLVDNSNGPRLVAMKRGGR